MKLSKLNAILIIFSLGISSALESQNDVPKNHPSKQADAYSANDMYVDNNPIKAIKKGESHFVEKKAQVKEQAPKPAIKTPTKVATTKIPSKNVDTKLVIIGNPKLKQDPKLSTYTKCGKKTGYLSMVKNPELIPKELRIIKIFANLSLNSLLLFMTSNPNSLFNSINLNNILRISQQNTLLPFNCFDIVLNEVKSNTLNKGPVTFCTKSKQEMDEWISTILEFKECKINVANVNKHSQVVVDFAKVNELLTSPANQITKKLTGAVATSKRALAQIKQAEKMKPLFYENVGKVNESPFKALKEFEIAKHLKTIFNEIKESNIQSKQVQRQMIDKLQRARKFAKEIKKKGERIKQLVEKRKEKEQERKTGLIQKEHKNKEIKLLKDVQTKIINLKKQEFKEFKQSYAKEIKKEKAKANEQAKNMMEIIMEETKLRPYDDCISSKLKKFEDKEYVEDLCSRFYGEARENMCRKKYKFCDMCCSHHIGVKYSDKLQECQQTCNDLVKHGIEPIRVVKKKVTVKPK